MRNRPWLAFLAVLLVFLTTPAVRGADAPRVFRCVLDGRPRMVVVQLDADRFLALDAENARVHRVWRGSIEFTGTVYDTKHGPQPRSVGTTLAEGTDQPVLMRDGQQLQLRWQGYELSEGLSGGLVKFFFALRTPDGADAGVAVWVVKPVVTEALGFTNEWFFEDEIEVRPESFIRLVPQEKSP